MKGSALFKFVNSLTEDESRLFKGLVSVQKDSKVLLKMIDILRSMDRYEEGKLLRDLKISRSQKNELFRQIDSPVMSSLATSDLDGRLVNAYCTARNLVFKIENEPAIALMKWAFKESLRIERFDIALDLWDLSEILTEPYQFEALSVEELGRLQGNLHDFRMLEARVKTFFRLDGSHEEKEAVLNEILNSPLLSSEENALSKRALWHYLKIKAVLFVITGNVPASLKPQSDFVELIKNNEWLRNDSNFFLVKEMGQLLKMSYEVSDYSKANRMIFQVSNIQDNRPRVEKEKLAQLYPYRLYLALLAGDEGRGYDVFEETTELLKDESLPAKFVTQNLYYCAYLQFTYKNFPEAFKIIRELKQYSRSNSNNKRSANFHPYFYSMVKVLEILVAFESEIDDSIRLIKNFRKSKDYDQSQFFKVLLGAITKAMSTPPGERQTVWRNALDKVAVIEDDALSSIYLHFFDIQVWFGSQISNNSMAQEYKKLSDNRGSRIAVS